MKRPAVLFLVLICVYSVLYTFLVFTLIDQVKRNPALIALLAPLLPLVCIATYAWLFREGTQGPGPGPSER